MLKKILSIISLISMGAIAQIPTNGLLAYYPFDGNANDESGNLLTGTITDGSFSNNRFSETSKSLLLQGVSGSFVNIANSSSLPQLSSDRNISAWIKTTGTGNIQIVSYGIGSNGNNCSVGVDNGAFFVSSWYTPQYTTSNYNINDGKWHFLSFNHKNGVMDCYLDGVLKDTRSHVFNTINNQFKIGSRQDGYAHFFPGNIDQVRIYNRALTTTEIDALYTEGCSQATTLVAPTFSAPKNNICVGETITYSINAVSNAFTYEWKLNGVISSANTGLSFTYTPVSAEANTIKTIEVRAKNSCGSSTNQILVYVNDVPAQPVVLTQAATPICEGTNSTYSVGIPPNYLTYEWTINNSNTPELINTNVLTKTWPSNNVLPVSVKAINDKGCKSTPIVFNTVVVNPKPLTPTPFTTPPTAVCSGVTSTFAVTPVAGTSYNWYLSTSPTPATPVKTGTSTSYTSPAWSPTSGNAIVRVDAVNATGCVNAISYQFSVAVTATPTTPSISGNTSNVCIYQNPRFAAINSQYATSYEWVLNSNILPQITQELIPTLVNGTNYTLSLTAKNGTTCKSNQVSVTFTANDKPMVPVISGPDEICPKTKNVAYFVVSPVNSNDYFYRINDEIKFSYKSNETVPYTKINVDFPFITGGKTYNIEVTASNTCGKTPNSKTVYAKIISNAEPIISCLSNNCNRLSIPVQVGGASISWSSNTSSLNSPEKVKRIGNKSLPVKVIVSENGCSYNTSWSECTGAIPNGAKMSDEEIEVSSAIFNAYPNPSEGTFVLETDGSAGEAYLISSLGQIIETIKLTEGVSVYNVSVSAKGSYLVRIKTTTANKSIKISVQ